MKLDIGGGTKPVTGDGWVNIDHCAGADIQHNLEVFPWPIADDAVEVAHSSHALEHLWGFFAALNEICRVCRLGAPVEIRLPHCHSQDTFAPGHRHCFSPSQAMSIEQFFGDSFWHGPKRLKLERIEYHPSGLLHDARAELPFLAGLSDETVMRWIPGTCHECRFFYAVVQNKYFTGAASDAGG